MICTVRAEHTGSCCYLIEEKGRVLIIDPNIAQEIIRIIDERGWKPEGILLTHEHFDHVEGLEQVRNTYRIPVTAGKMCSRGIQDTRMNLSGIYDIFVFFHSGTMPEKRHPRFTCKEAECVFEKEYEFTWQGHQFWMKELPGHSQGSTVIEMDDDILFSGDYLIKGQETITRLAGGDEKVFRERTMELLNRIARGRIIYPGHGESYRMK